MKFKMSYFGAPIVVKQHDETWSLTECLFDQGKLKCQRKLRLPPVVTLKSDFIFDNVLKMRLAKSDLISVEKYLALGNLSNFYLTSVSKVSEQTIDRQMSFSCATWHIHSNFKKINCEIQLLSEHFLLPETGIKRLSNCHTELYLFRSDIDLYAPVILKRFQTII